ncbi:2-polyprenyl-6-methoxyphenol hydroxylase-like FAD-dependent oxidoreductase [Neorhizobium galegae]|uniref:FAD-dependent monooxygenase n=1 Tax=Neorhizobium galegae TaxID=399 RepID=UPI0027828577|nr:FAD-dependent monooxygenase [Neorhizobium galegae]MDQ0137821.1 2-polyprenyl-6-methoxyphenol hydroxylase-like FAD-dependent oxidoreductase [Neorhizobium galegae]
MGDRRKALVIGGGIAGMSAAISLREAGLDVHLCDQDPHWRVYGAGITITGPTLRAMGRLGILEAVLERGHAADGIDICSAEGKPLFQIDTRGEALGAIPSAGGILRPVLHGIMSERLLALAPEIRLGVTVEEIDWQGDLAHVRFSKGESTVYDLVVGADGIYSRTRQQMFPEAPVPRYAGQMCWRLMMPRHPEIRRRTFFLGGPAKVGLNPVAPDQMYMFYLEAQPEPVWREEANQHEVLRELLHGYGGVLKETAQGLTAGSNIICRPLETVLAGESWVRANTVLIGDAAHATTPQLASGAGMGIEDGLVLGEEIARHAHVPTALQSFMRRRYDRCKLVVDSSLEISRLERERAAPQAQTAIVEKALAALSEEF